MPVYFNISGTSLICCFYTHSYKLIISYGCTDYKHLTLLNIYATHYCQLCVLFHYCLTSHFSNLPILPRKETFAIHFQYTRYRKNLEDYRKILEEICKLCYSSWISQYCGKVLRWMDFTSRTLEAGLSK